MVSMDLLPSALRWQTTNVSVFSIYVKTVVEVKASSGVFEFGTPQRLFSRAARKKFLRIKPPERRGSARLTNSVSSWVFAQKPCSRLERTDSVLAGLLQYGRLPVHWPSVSGLCVIDQTGTSAKRDSGKSGSRGQDVCRFCLRFCCYGRYSNYDGNRAGRGDQ